MNENECNKNCKKNAETWIKNHYKKFNFAFLILLFFQNFELWAGLKAFKIKISIFTDSYLFQNPHSTFKEC